MGFDMHVDADRFGDFSLTALAVANICHGILHHIDDGAPKLKAEATTSEIVMMASGISPQHFGWIDFYRQDPEFLGHFQSLRSHLDLGPNGLRLIYSHTLREVNEVENRWVDKKYEAATVLTHVGQNDLSAISEWIKFTSIFFHRYDGINLTVPDEQTWF